MFNRHTAPSITTALALLAFAGCAFGDDPGPRAPAPGNVVVDYGTPPEDGGTAAVESVTSVSADASGRTALDLLDGRIAGLQIVRDGAGNAHLTLRGPNTFRGNGQPLLVVDGVPLAPFLIGSVLGAIPADAVARIDVLKDASSAAIYGSRGGNGVIIVRTRR